MTVLQRTFQKRGEGGKRPSHSGVCSMISASLCVLLLFFHTIRVRREREGKKGDGT